MRRPIPPEAIWIYAKKFSFAWNNNLRELYQDVVKYHPDITLEGFLDIPIVEDSSYSYEENLGDTTFDDIYLNIETEVPNPNYEDEYKAYQEDLELWKLEEERVQLKAAADLKTKARNSLGKKQWRAQKQRRKLFEELKAEFEPGG